MNLHVLAIHELKSVRVHEPTMGELRATFRGRALEKPVGCGARSDGETRLRMTKACEISGELDHIMLCQLMGHCGVCEQRLGKGFFQSSLSVICACFVERGFEGIRSRVAKTGR